MALSQVSISGLADENSSRKTQLKNSGTTQTGKDFKVSDHLGDCATSAKMRNGPVSSRSCTAAPRARKPSIIGLVSDEMATATASTHRLADNALNSSTTDARPVRRTSAASND